MFLRRVWNHKLVILSLVLCMFLLKRDTTKKRDAITHTTLKPTPITSTIKDDTPNVVVTNTVMQERRNHYNDSVQPWVAAMQQVPPQDKIPMLYLAHGSPFLLLKDDGIDMVGREFQKDGEHYMFLQKLGPFLLERFRPEAIIVFSAHYETRNLVHVFSRDAPNKLFYDYYGFPKWMFDLSFPSKGSSKVAQQVLNCLESNNISAAAVSGDRGLDHGVFVPFSIMFPTGLSIPVVEISMPSLDPFKLIAIGAALDDLRKDYLIVSGGLSIHTFEDPTAFNREFAADGFKQFHSDLLDAISIQDTDRRNRQLHAMMMHPFFRAAHPREEHFVPLFIPAGARGRTQVLCDLYGAVTALFGLNA